MIEETKRGPILVTGGSAGIGRYLAEYLAKRGHEVFATVRGEEDAKRLSRVSNVHPLTVDVTRSEQIDQCVREISDRGRLYGLVNNAGIGGLGMLSTWTDEEIHHIFDVNVFGPHRMTNALLPFLVASQGRIVNIGSQGGMLSKPYFGPYTMTKHALESYTETLRCELGPYGVLASIVQPGGIVTGIGEAALAGTLARFRRAVPPFVEEAERMVEAATTLPPQPPDDEESEENRKPSSPEIVAAAVYDALFSERPKLRYLVGTRWEGDRVIHALIDRLLDENDSPSHGYGRNELVALLEQHLDERQVD